MFCWNCGKKISERTRYCPYCDSSQDGVHKSEISQSTTVEAIVSDQTVAAQASATEPMPLASPSQPIPTQAAQTQDASFPPPVSAPVFPDTPPLAPATCAVPPGITSPVAMLPEKKKRKKLPFIIGGAVVVVAIVVVAVVFIVRGAVADNAFDALGVATENLMYKTESGTVEATFEAGGEQEKMGLSWDLGKDLKNSTIWIESSDGGVIIKDDKIYDYSSRSSLGSPVSVTSGFIDSMNEVLSEEYGVPVDINNIVKDEKFNKAYIDELSKLLREANSVSLASDEDVLLMTEILGDFINDELSKKDVRESIFEDSGKSKSGDEIKYEGTLRIGNLFKALSEYAEERSKDSRYKVAADSIVEMYEPMSMYLMMFNDFDVTVVLQKDILKEFSLKLNLLGESAEMRFDVKNVNNVDLNNNRTLNDFINKAVPSSEPATTDSLLGGII